MVGVWCAGQLCCTRYSRLIHGIVRRSEGNKIIPIAAKVLKGSVPLVAWVIAVNEVSVSACVNGISEVAYCSREISSGQTESL